MSLKENEIKELGKRGFDTTELKQKPKSKTGTRSFDNDFSVSIRRILSWIAIILFIMMLLLIPQCIYYMKLLEQLAKLGV